MIKKVDRKNRFVSVFDPNTGFYARSGVLDECGKDTGVDPFMTAFPELLDIGVMGHCVHGASGLCFQSGVQCYQNGLKTKEPNMNLENFKRIVDECKGKAFQLALGGRGDVDQHENFAEILKYCRENGIVPNFTSSGLGFTDEIVQLCKQYCGAVAISWYRQKHTYRAIQMLLEAVLFASGYDNDTTEGEVVSTKEELDKYWVGSFGYLDYNTVEAINEASEYDKERYDKCVAALKDGYKIVFKNVDYSDKTTNRILDELSEDGEAVKILDCSD